MRSVLTPVLLLAVFLSALQIVLAQHESRKSFMEIQKLERTRNSLNEEWGRLQLELSTWAIDDRIEQSARTRLQMSEPDTAHIVLLTK